MVSWRPEVSFLLGASRPLTRAEGALELWTLGKQGQENRRAGRGWSAATNSRQVARIEGRWRESGRGADETGWGPGSLIRQWRDNTKAHGAPAAAIRAGREESWSWLADGEAQGESAPRIGSVHWLWGK